MHAGTISFPQKAGAASGRDSSREASAEAAVPQQAAESISFEAKDQTDPSQHLRLGDRVEFFIEADEATNERRAVQVGPPRVVIVDGLKVNTMCQWGPGDWVLRGKDREQGYLGSGTASQVSAGWR